MIRRNTLLAAALATAMGPVAVAEQLHFDLEPAPPIPAETAVSEATNPAPQKTHNPDNSKSVAKIGGPIATPTSEVSGSLDGRIVYLMSGHGWTYSSPGVWYTQRGVGNNMIEDFGNHDQGTMMADLLLNAGATVVPLRPFGIQENEVVIDNDDPQVTFGGSWSNSGSTTFYGTSGDVPYRFASSTSGAATATAVYDASLLIPETDYYPVYVWARWGTDRIAQQYIVAHSGGTTSRRINHQRVGSGWIYLGTFHFETGGPASVTITNAEAPGEPGSVVIADAVRFGNGMGDATVEGEASNHPRHEENGEYWLAESRGFNSGLTTSGSVSSPPRLAAHMNYTGGGNSGSDTDRVYLSFHSNAGGGRGADGLFNNNPGDACGDPGTANSFNTPNGVDFAIELGTRVNTDMTTVTNASGNPFENTWGQSGAGTNIFGSGCGGGGGFSAYGEINNSYFVGEMAATIIEVAFHDSALDAALMRDPKAREAMARACLHGVINHFDSVASGPTVYPPEQPDDVYVVSDNSGNLTLHWTPPVAGGPFGAGGGSPTGYIVETSSNGRGFVPATTVVGIATSNANVTSLVPPGSAVYMRVVAINAGGVSMPSVVVGAKRNTAAASTLIVNGFDRYDRTLNYRQTEAAYLGSQFAGGGTFDRVISRFNNRFDYAVDLGEALEAANVTFDVCQNEQIASGAVSLADYHSVYWILGAESTADSAFDSTEQAAVSAYLSGGGNLFVSGSEAAWDLGRTAASGSNKTFLENTLRVAQFTSGNPQDDAGTYTATGVAAGVFDGIGPVTFSDGSDIHGDFDVAFPDILVPINGSVSAMSYVGGSGGSAAITWAGTGKLVYLGFPLETVTDPADVASIVNASEVFFGAPSAIGGWEIY